MVKKLRNVLPWLPPIALAALITVFSAPVISRAAKQDITLAQYVAGNDAKIGQEKADGFSQIYYKFNGRKTLVTDARYTNAAADTNRQYMTWMGQVGGGWRIFLYHIPTSQQVELTSAGINVNPRISGKYVVWEGQIEGRWQIWLFDGISVRQLTTGDISLNVDIRGNEVIYDRQDETGQWRAVRYSLKDASSVEAKLQKVSKEDIVQEIAGRADGT